SRFVMLLKNKSMAELETRLNELLASVQKQVYEKCTKQIYLVVGIYEMVSESVGIMGALDRAIRAQKTVKDRSFYRENAVAVYDNKLREELQNRQYVEAHMLEALENDEFKVFYQPKVSIASGKIVGAEALVRWIRPNGEVISPAMFVPIFEENGFITDMDFAIYRHAVSDIKRWLRNGYDVPLVSLNVSRHHLKDDNFAYRFTALVDSLGVPHDKIELEVTESLLTDNLNKLVEVMSELKSIGFRISVDDFGSGYSSLNLITQLPFDTLKIDGGFFLKNDLTEKNKKVISSVVTLAKSLNLETVSEGVETQTQVDFLRDLGCNMIQGYFYYKPMPTGDFENLIAQKSEKE
ncbi:MAG: EAL domain-containing protein, partial [Oscillospiraceae bacterium]|nr:EAL domain-containing protein [Oscillospiraceae bacterium]